MANIKLTYKDNKAYYANISKKFQEEAEMLIEDTAENIQTDAQTRVPVDNGILRSSITKQVKGLEASVGTKLHYAPYVEFGTGGLVDVPNGLEDYASQYKGAGIKEVNLPARPYLFNSWRENGDKMIQRLKVLINGN